MVCFPKPDCKTNRVATVSILHITIFSAPNQEFNFLMKEQMNKWKTTEWMDKWMNEGRKILRSQWHKEEVYQILSHRRCGLNQKH